MSSKLLRTMLIIAFQVITVGKTKINTSVYFILQIFDQRTPYLLRKIAAYTVICMWNTTAT